MRLGILALVVMAPVAIGTGCAPSVAIEVSLPDTLDRSALTGLRILALPESSTALAVLRGDSASVSCRSFSALRARRGRTPADDLAETLAFPLVDGEGELQVADRVEPDGRVFVHVVALARAERLVGQVGLSATEPIALNEVAAAPVAEGCACARLEGPDPTGDCEDATAGPIAVTLAALVAPREELRVVARGPTATTVVRGMPALIAPAVRVEVPPCSGAEDSPACLSCDGDCRHPDLPVSASIAGDPTVTLRSTVLLTNPDGDVVVPVDVGDCPTGSFELTLGLVGYPAPVRIQGTCVDDAPAAREPSVVAEDLGSDVALATVGRQVVALSDVGSDAVLTVVGGAPPVIRGALAIAGERPQGLVAYGDDGVVVATVDAALVLHLRRYALGADGTLTLRAETSGLCEDAGCGLASNACTSPLVCTSPTDAESASLDVTDVDGDGIAEVSLVRKDVGLTVYDGDLTACRRITALASTATRHVMARFAGDVRFPSVVAADGSGLALRPPDPQARSGRPCDPAAPACGPGRTCHVPCPGGVPCVQLTTTVRSGTCITPCAAMGEPCGRGGKCARVPGDVFACLEPGLACGLGSAGSAVGVLVGYSGELRRGTLRAQAAGREDLVMLNRNGAPNVVFGAEEPLNVDNEDTRRTTLFARPLSGEPPRSSRAVAVGDVDGDGVDDLAVAYEDQVRTWLGGAGVPGEASAIAVPECEPVALAIVDVAGTGRAGVMVACRVAAAGSGFESAASLRYVAR